MKEVLALSIAAVIIISGCTAAPSGNIKAHVYKSANCGCCTKYIPYLQQNGFQIETISLNDMGAIKHQYGIPKEMESCHTMVIGDYFVEGHVPVEAITKLLEEKPAIKGIALPGMLAGSPGMPGIKQGPFVIYAISETGITEFMRI